MSNEGLIFVVNKEICLGTGYSILSQNSPTPDVIFPSLQRPGEINILAVFLYYPQQTCQNINIY